MVVGVYEVHLIGLSHQHPKPESCKPDSLELLVDLLLRANLLLRAGTLPINQEWKHPRAKGHCF